MLAHTIDLTGLYLLERPLGDPQPPRTFRISPVHSIILAKAEEPNTRWVTLKPNGADSDAYLRVKLRMNADGSAHVITGPKDLRGLRLTKLASNRELKDRARDRQARRREKARAAKEAIEARRTKEDERAAKDPEYAKELERQRADEGRRAEERQRALRDEQENIQRLTATVAQAATQLTGDARLEALGDTPEERAKRTEELRQQAIAGLNKNDTGEGDDAAFVDPAVAGGAAATVASRDRRRIESAINRLERQVITELVRDDHLAAAVLNGDPADLTGLQPTGKSERLGYRRDAKGMAEKHGFTAEDAKAESEAAFQERLKGMAPREADASVRLRDTMRRMARTARTLARDPEFSPFAERPPESKVDPEELARRADQAREFLRARSELREAQRRRRALELGEDPDATTEERDALAEHDQLPEGLDLAEIEPSERAFREDLKARLRDVAATELTTAFLDSIDSQASDAGVTVDRARAAMIAHVHAGAAAHFANAALTMTGSEGVDRMVVDTLGINAAAALTAHMLRRPNANDIDTIQAGLATYHDQHSLALMREAMSDAEAARAAAQEIEVPPVNGAVDAGVVQDLLNEKREQLASAQASLGSALGQVEAGAALNLALRATATDQLTVDFAKRDTTQVATALRALGLNDAHYRLTRDPGSNILTAVINAAGMDALTPSLDPERAERRRDVAAIQDGAEDEPDWLPEGFARRPAATFERGTEPPTLRGEPAFSPERPPREALREYAASLYADGYTPSQIYTELTSVSFQQAVPANQRADVTTAIDELLPMRQTTPHLTKAAMDELEERLRPWGVTPPSAEFERIAAREAADQAEREAQFAPGDPGRRTYLEVTGRDIDGDERVQSELQRAAEQYLQDRYPGETAFHSQRLDENDPTVREAVFRTVAAHPALQVAYRDPADLDSRATRAIRDYYLKNILEPTLGGATWQEDQAQRKQEYDTAKSELDDRWKRLGGGNLPSKFRRDDDTMFNLFGGSEGDDAVRITFKTGADATAQADALTALGLRPEHYTRQGTTVTLNAAGKDALDVRAAARRAHQLKNQDDDRAAGNDDSPLAAIATGLESVNPHYLEYLGERMSLDRKYADGRGRWAELLEHAGSPARAYAAVQEHMRGTLAGALQDQLGRVSGRQPRISKATTEHHRAILRATNEEALERLRRRDRETDERNRSREGGKYTSMGGAGSVAGIRDATQAADERNQAAATVSLFGTDEPQGLFGPTQGVEQGALLGGETTARRAREIKPEPWERLTLGHTAETTLKRILDQHPYGIDPNDSPTSLIPDVTWGAGTPHVTKQRFAKALERGHRLAMLFGTGTGKTATQLGAFTHLQAKGKAKKGLFVVPSAVRNQFGEEATRFLEPGRYKWHARNDTFEGRLAAYRDPGTHMVVVTHAAFRDDMVKLVARHRDGGGDVRATAEWLRDAAPEERTAALAAALKAEGMDPKDLYLAIDEGHDFLNRAGKPDSLQGKVADSLMQLAEYATPATGSPIKNDLSEAFDWLHKLDGERFPDRDAFMRRYAVNSEASREALKRIMAQYSMVDANEPPVISRETWGAAQPDGTSAPIALTDAQRAAYRAVGAAARTATRAARAGRVDVEAMKVLSPTSFEGVPEAEHRAIAAKLSRSIGTLKHSALNRVVSDHPAAENAKVQHVLNLADSYRRARKAGVIFADHRASVAMLRDTLTKAGHRVAVIDGSASSDDKARARRAFDNGDVDIVIASRAGETGMNLQKRGRWLIQYDIPDTQKSVEQRTARIKRLGQTSDIEIHHLQTDARVDDLARRRVTRKARLGSALQGPYQSVDDLGLAQAIATARLEASNDLPDVDNEPIAA